eukprot:15299-Eustigmatos_ZCMA.PRE.1
MLEWVSRSPDFDGKVATSGAKTCKHAEIRGHHWRRCGNPTNSITCESLASSRAPLSRGEVKDVQREC